jgi:2-polyprenyl-6-methoxyphenol hydroxylase-like FAD-dependent oxidoreductase
VLISGAGIAGPTLAYWLSRYNFETTVVERARRLRTAGYVIDFWGAGYEIADRMGLLPEIQRKGYLVREVRAVDRNARRVASFPTEALQKVTGDRFISLPRGDLAAAIYGSLGQKVETIFGDTVSRIDQTQNDVRVKFDSGAERNFDLVIGADGLHSRVRELVFGPEERFEKYLGLKVAAFEVEGYQPRDELIYVMFTEPGQQVARLAMRNDRTMFLFTFSDKDPDTPGTLEAQKAMLRKRFGGSGWECSQILDALDGAQDLYFDRVSQIRMQAEQGLWTRDRVTLIGDAASCVSFLAGQGSALAMAAAYILAGELHRSGGDYKTAFRRYQDSFAPFVKHKQEGALRLASFFAPASKRALFMRNQIMNLLRFPLVAKIAFARDLSDDITLPAY